MDLDFDDKKKYEEFYNLIGAKIRFKCDGFVQEGIIKSVKPKRVTIRNVYYFLPNQKKFTGMLKYRFHELANYEVIATAKEVNPYPRFEYLENILKSDNGGKKYSLNDLFYDGYLTDSEDEEDNKDTKEEEFKIEVPSHLEKKVPLDFVTIDCMDLEWNQALKHIGLQKRIGVSFHGTKITRLGKLSWMSISTVWCTFLFDIEKLGVDAFNHGLKNILENQKIIKVIHDCRFPSEILAHKFNTKLTNVFDILVADFVVSMQCYNDKHKYEYVQCLNSCLRIYLEVPPEFSYALDRYKQNSQDNIYSKRPLNNSLRSILIKDTVYLMQLHDVLAKKLLGPVQRNADRYLKVIACASKQELETVGNEISSPDVIPPSILMYGIQTVKFSKLERKEPVSLKCKFLDPRTGKEIHIKKQTADEIEDRQLPVLKDNNSRMTQSLHLNRKSVIVDKMIATPSFRQMDEIYHKLANCKYFDSKNMESIINVKPSKKYESKFTMRMPLECSAFSNSGSCDTDRKTDYANTSNNLPDYSDTWAKLRAESSDERNVSQNAKNSNIRFVPAGMSDLKVEKSSTAQSSRLNKKSIIGDKRIVTPSLQHTDEVYHKVANNKYSQSENCENVNTKPTKNYESKFTMRKPLEHVVLNKRVALRLTNFLNPSFSSSVMVSNTSDNLSRNSDTSTKLEASFRDKCPVSQQGEKSSKFQFLSAAMSVEKQKKNCTTESLQLNKTSSREDKIIASTSSQHTDEVYHKLANNKFSCSTNTESISNVKTSKNYEPKFTISKPLQSVAFSNTNSCETHTVGNMDFPNPSTNSSVTVSNTSDNLPDYSDTWAKLQAESSDECNVSQNAKNSNIRFVPAGMSDLKVEKSSTAQSSRLNKKSIIGDKRIATPILQHMDEVYHKVANNKYSHSENGENVNNIKPAKNYESKFTMRKPLEHVVLNKRVALRLTNFLNPSSSSSVMVPNTSDNLSRNSDTSTKLEASFSDKCPVSQQGEKSSKFQFLSAAMSVEKQKKNCTTESLQLNKTSLREDKIIASTSSQHTDEVYHKLANNKFSCSTNTESISNVKTSKNYEPKFTIRKPLQSVAFSNTNSCETHTVGNMDFPNPSTNSSVTVSNTSDNLPDYSDTWAKLRAESSDERNVSQNAKNSNIRFVPAGMSC